MTSLKRITKELKDISEKPPAGIRVTLVDESDLHKWKVLMSGPEGTPFAGGTFTVLITLPKDYPFHPPSVNFITRVWHPNVTQDGAPPLLPSFTDTNTPKSTASDITHISGSMCIGMLRPDEWKPSSRVTAVLEFARQLLKEPLPDDAVEPRIAEQFRDRRKEWEKKAKEWTAKYAKEDGDAKTT